MRCWRSTQDALLHMTATNMEVTLRQDVPLLAYEGGDTTFAIDAKLLSAMLANLPGIRWSAARETRIRWHYPVTMRTIRYQQPAAKVSHA